MNTYKVEVIYTKTGSVVLSHEIEVASAYEAIKAITLVHCCTGTFEKGYEVRCELVKG